MKIAQLPNGEEMEFPPETDDEHISAAVRRRLGLPNEPSRQDMASAQHVAMLRAAVQQFTMLLQGMQQALAAIADSNRNVADLVSKVDEAVHAVNESARAIAQPRKLTVQRGKDGKAQAVLSVPQSTDA